MGSDIAFNMIGNGKLTNQPNDDTYHSIYTSLRNRILQTLLIHPATTKIVRNMILPIHFIFIYCIATLSTM